MLANSAFFNVNPFLAMESIMADLKTNLASSRRDFLKNLAIAAPTAALACVALAQPQSGSTGTGTSTGADTGKGTGTGSFVPESDPTAKALGYVADATKAERPKKGETEGKDQKCSNCQFYAPGPAINGHEAGKCLMIPAGLVHAEGWCKSWLKKVSG
jgi:hypothetical protein